MTFISVCHRFPAAHRIRIDDRGTREPVHVHHWRVQVKARAGASPEPTAVALGEMVRRWVRRHRGHSLNDVPPFDLINPTAEEVARELARRIRDEVPAIEIVEITIGEAAGFSATYRP